MMGKSVKNEIRVVPINSVPRKKRISVLSSACCATFIAALPLAAENTMAAVTSDAGSTESVSPRRASQVLLEEVVVTARKRSAGESAQDVPITMTAVSGDQLEAAFITDMTQLGNIMPNVNLDGAIFPGIANFTIRGMGFNSSIASTEPTVGIFVDGVYLGVTHGATMGIFDLETVEVLRGPQGTMFGRNVTAGAVVMRSRRPTDEFGGVVRLGLGSGGRQLIGTGIEGGLTENLAGKIYAEFNKRSGDFTNTFNGQDIGAEDSLFLRQIFVWNPSDTVEITTIAEHGSMDADYATLGRPLNDPTTLIYQNGVREPRRADQLNHNLPGRSDMEWNQFTLDARWQIGNGSLVSITGYRDVDYASGGEADASPLDIAYGFVGVEQRQFSQELRYAGRALSDKLDYVVGVNYFEQDLDNTYEVIFFGTPFQRPRGKVDHRAHSVFAHGDYELIPNVSVSAGLRYDYEKKDATIARGIDNCDPHFNCTYDFLDSKDWASVTPKLGVNWMFSPDAMVYASWSKGFRSGGYNSRATDPVALPGPYDEEEVTAIEIGFKSDFLDGRARLNGALFHNSYEDLQRDVADDDLNRRTLNAADATIKGAELDLVLLPIDGLVLQASVGWQDAAYDSDVAGEPLLTKGLQLIRAPEWTYSLSGTYDHSLGDAGSLIGRVSYSFTDDTPMNDADRYTLDGYELVEASLTWKSLDESLSISAWGKNLTNEVYGLTGTTLSTFTLIHQSLPRTYGLELIYRF